MSKSKDWIHWNLFQWAQENKLTLVNEYKFAPDRKYKSDWALPQINVLIEYEGGIYMKRGGHNSPSGIQRDIDKYELAHKLGFTVYRLTVINYKTIITKLNEHRQNADRNL